MDMTLLQPMRRIWFYLACALVLVVVAASLAASFPWLQDYPEWLYQAWLFPHVLFDAEGGEAFDLARYPVPNSTLLTLALNGLAALLGWTGAAKALLVGYALLFLIGLQRLWRHWGVEHGPWLTFLALPLVVFSTAYWNGFLSYQLSLLVLVWFLGVHDRDTKATTIALFGILIFFAHAVGMALLCGFVIGRALLDRFPRRQLTGLVPVLVLSLWYFFGRMFADVSIREPGADVASWLELIQLKGYLIARTGPFQTFLLSDGTSVTESFNWLYQTGFVANFLYAVTIIGFWLMFVLGARLGAYPGAHAGAPQSRVPVSTVRLLISAAFLVHILAPYNFFGLYNIGERLIIPLVLLMFAALSPQRHVLTTLSVFCLLFFSVTVGGYVKAIMNEPRAADPVAPIGSQARDEGKPGIREFNEWVYRDTAHRYFNHRLFAMYGKLAAIEHGRYQDIHLNNGLLTGKGR